MNRLFIVYGSINTSNRLPKWTRLFIALQTIIVNAGFNEPYYNLTKYIFAFTLG